LGGPAKKKTEEEEKNKGGSTTCCGADVSINNYDVAHYKSVLIFYFDGD
jgi:hypothetical protein